MLPPTDPDTDTSVVDPRVAARAAALAVVPILQWVRFRSLYGEPGVAVATHRNATLVPPPTGADERSFESSRGGVVDTAGQFVPHADHYASVTPWVQSSGSWNRDLERHPVVRLGAGRVLYGGVAREHFGHFVTESLSRLWPLYLDTPDRRIVASPTGPFDAVAFLRSPVATPSRAGLDLVALFDRVPPVVVVDEPTAVDEIVVPMQSSASEAGLVGPATVMAALRRHLAPDLPASGQRSIYVSRSRWDPGAVAYSGSVIGEETLEDALAQDGYEVFHPQEHTVREQVETYRTAGRIVVNESSAAHLVALAAPAAARVAVIGRRPGSGPLLEAHLEGALGASLSPRFIECADGYGIEGVPHEVWAALRWPEVRDALVARGLLRADARWPNPSTTLAQVERRRDLLAPGAAVARVF